MGSVLALTHCCSSSIPKPYRPTLQRAALGMDIVLGVALTAIALYGLLSGSLPQGISQMMLVGGATYLGLVLLNVLVMVKITCCAKGATSSGDTSSFGE